MPDPGSLKVGDLVRFIALPDEWSRPDFKTPRDSVAFMKVMIKRKGPSRIWMIDEFGCPWIRARIYRRGKLEAHSWAIFESTGWRRVVPRG